MKSENLESLSLWGYFVRAITKDYSNFSGRARRKEYWSFCLFSMLIYFVCAILSNILNQVSEGIFILFAIAYLVWLIPSVAVAVRRLHDTDRSGWWFFTVSFTLG